MPTPSPLFIDKIALTIPLNDEQTRVRVENWFHATPSNIRGFPISATRGGRFYWYSKEVLFDEEARCTLLAEFDPRGSASRVTYDTDGDAESEPDIDVHALSDTRRPFRIEWNPSRIQEIPEYAEAFSELMREWFGDSLASEMADANITRIDLATDIQGLNINRIIAARNDTTVISTSYGRDGSRQSLYLGAKNSDLRFVIYDKRAQLRGRVRGGQYERTRIEVRIKQRLQLSSLLAYKNPFDRLLIREVKQLEAGAVGNSPHIWDWFVDSCDRRGGMAALNLIRNSRTRQTWRNKVALRDAPTWWNPEELWDELPNVIRRLDLWQLRRRRPTSSH